MELYSSCPDAKLESRIRKKVDSIPDLNEASQDTDFKLPLSLFSKAGMISMVRHLLEIGANPNSQSNYDISPLTCACMEGHIQVAEELLSNGAELFQEIRMNHVEEGTSFHVSQALWATVRSGKPETVDFLISKGCDVNQLDLNGDTLLHKAADNGNVEMLKHLVKLGIPVNKGTSGDNEPAIHYAIGPKGYEAAETLIELGADVNALDSFRGEEHSWDNTPLDLAYVSGNKKLVELLLSHGALKGEDVIKNQS